MPKEPTLRLNKETGYYEGLLLVQVESELFRRILLRTVEEHETADLTDPTTWADAITKVGKMKPWLDKPHTKVTPVEVILPAAEVKPEEHRTEKPETKLTEAKQGVLSDLETTLREQARHLPPYAWEEKLLASLESVAHLHKHDTEKTRVYQLRCKQGKILKQLYAAWEQGEFILDVTAANEQQAHTQQEENRLTAKLELVAGAVNGSRFH